MPVDLNTIKKEVMLSILDLHKRANSGHIGTSLSCLDIMLYLYFKRMNKEDKFILSKGHAATALYCVLAKTGHIPKELLEQFCADGTLLAAHPPCGGKLKGIPFGTGSLGHGLSLAAGIALSSGYTKIDRNVYCVLSDGDCNEGSTWEAALFSAQNKLDNLFVIIDNNKLQGLGRSKDILDLEPLEDKWRSFNFDVAIASKGNDTDSISSAFKELDKKKTKKPKCIIARTTKGSGISFMADKYEWHYLPMSPQQYELAKKEINSINA